MRLVGRVCSGLAAELQIVVSLTARGSVLVPLLFLLYLNDLRDRQDY